MVSDSEQCQFLRSLLKIMNAKKIIEVGLYTLHTLLYYQCCWVCELVCLLSYINQRGAIVIYKHVIFPYKS
jgi:hypothetical protein